MACEICKRGSCTRSFHSLEEQERFDSKQQMSDDIDELRDEIIEQKEEINRLTAQLAEAKASAESWQENCRLTEDELEKERDRHADTIGKLAERDAEIADCNKFNFELQRANAALREEVEKYKCLDGFKQLQEEARKQTAHEVVEMCRRIMKKTITSNVGCGDYKHYCAHFNELDFMRQAKKKFRLEG